MTRQLKRAVVPGLLLIAGYYAVFGGEYSVFELRAAREAAAAEHEKLALVQAEIDSMRALADSLTNDPLMIERVAREEFGMIREGETLYRFADREDDPAASAEERAPER